MITRSIIQYFAEIGIKRKYLSKHLQVTKSAFGSTFFVILQTGSKEKL